MSDLIALLSHDTVVTHSVVLGELAVGNLRDRARTLAHLHALLDAVESPPRDVLDFLENQRLYGVGLSWGDVQLLAASKLNAVPLWTLDQQLSQAAQSLNLAWLP